MSAPFPCRFDWGTTFTPDELDALRRVVPDVPFSLKENGSLEQPYPSWRADPSAVLQALPGKRLVLEGAELTPTVVEVVLQRLEAIAQRVSHWGHGAGALNDRVHVHVPDLGLLLMTEVMACPNACTDEVQGHLREGWRILAICPQPDQRRPDYVLGRAPQATQPTTGA